MAQGAWGGALSGRKLLSPQHVASTLQGSPLSEAVTVCEALARSQEPVSRSASTIDLLCGTGQVPTLPWVLVSSSAQRAEVGGQNRTDQGCACQHTLSAWQV